MWGHPRWTGHGGEFWQNMVHWRRECKSLQHSCLENPMNSMKRQKNRTPKDELPKSVGAQYATGEKWRNRHRKDEEMEPNQKQHPGVDVTGDGSKVWCCKNNIAQEPGVLGPWIKANWKWANRRWQEWTLTFWESENYNGPEWWIEFRWPLHQLL